MCAGRKTLSSSIWDHTLSSAYRNHGQGSPVIPCPLFSSDMHSTPQWPTITSAGSAGESSQDSANLHLYTTVCTSLTTHSCYILKSSCIKIKKKKLCILPLYILQRPMQHLTRDRNDFWKHNTIYHCLSKENYKNANWFQNLHIWFFLKMR